jgi:hypothetical protein
MLKYGSYYNMNSMQLFFENSSKIADLGTVFALSLSGITV